MSSGEDAKVSESSFSFVISDIILCCRQGISPVYEILNTRGYDHSRLFTMQVVIHVVISGMMMMSGARGLRMMMMMNMIMKSGWILTSGMIMTI